MSSVCFLIKHFRKLRKKKSRYGKHFISLLRGKYMAETDHCVLELVFGNHSITIVVEYPEMNRNKIFKNPWPRVWRLFNIQYTASQKLEWRCFNIDLTFRSKWRWSDFKNKVPERNNQLREKKFITLNISSASWGDNIWPKLVIAFLSSFLEIPPSPSLSNTLKWNETRFLKIHDHEL